MAKEIKVDLQTSGIGSSLYGVMFNDAMQPYNAATSAFEAFNPANYTATKYCALALTEVGTMGVYTLDMPTGIPSGYYWFVLKRRAGASPAQSDPSLLSEIWPVVWDAAQVVDGIKLLAPMKKNSAFSNYSFTMISSSDHVSPFSGGVTGTVSLDGGVPVALTNAPTLVSAGEGMYKVNFAAADLNANTALMTFTGTGADKTRIQFFLQP